VVAQAIAEIANNTYAGAVEIADRGADVLLRCSRTCELETIEGYRQELLRIGWELIEAQPAMAPLVNLVNDALWRTDGCDSAHTMRTTIAKVAHDFKRRLRVHEAAIAESTLPLIPEGARVMTNSRSSTVRSALLHAQRAGRRFSVICAEGRPGCEGRTLAAELAQAGIPVTLVVDALAVAWVDRVDLILIGADHLALSGLVNKAGTSGLALIAQSHDVPMYAVCTSEKFLPPDYVPPSQTSRPSEQVWDDAPTDVRIENYYFDRTPLSHLSGIVTERGVLTSAGIEGWLAATHLYPLLNERYAA
jgi:translation initiation factor 2B subunit (eIF-2B alpha/beta/delta family)